MDKIRVTVRGDRYNPRPFTVRKPKKILFWKSMAKWYPMHRLGENKDGPWIGVRVREWRED